MPRVHVAVHKDDTRAAKVLGPPKKRISVNNAAGRDGSGEAGAEEVNALSGWAGVSEPYLRGRALQAWGRGEPCGHGAVASPAGMGPWRALRAWGRGEPCGHGGRGHGPAASRSVGCSKVVRSTRGRALRAKPLPRGAGRLASSERSPAACWTRGSCTATGGTRHGRCTFASMQTACTIATCAARGGER